MLSNIWNHPKTTAAGVLIAIATIAGVFLGQGVTLGSAGTGTVVGLIAAVCTALLGLLAKDPGSSSPQSSPTSSTTQKLGVIALIALLVPLPWMTGCTVTSAQLQADGEALGTALASLSQTLAAAGVPQANQLAIAAAGITAAAQNWTGDTSEQKLNALAAGAEAVLGDIPPAAPYAAAVGVVVAAIDVILANTTVSSSAVQARAAAPGGSATLAVYRAIGTRLLKHRLGRSPKGDFQAAWKLATAN